jgi:serine/threonine-protein kinase
MNLHRVVVPLAAVWLLSVPAFAAGAADQAAAEALFNEAKKLVAAGDFEHACPKFAESNRLDPGSGTLLNLGACYEQTGKLASAWGAFNEAAVTARNAGDSSRQAEATRRAEALLPRLTKLTITVPPTARVPGIELRRDGEVVGEGQWGSPIPADAGQHKIEVSAPGHRAWSTVVRLDSPGTTSSVDVPVLEKLSVKSVTNASGSGWSTQRTVGATVAGVGVLGLAVGGILGGVTLVKAGTLKSGGDCNTDLTICSATGLQLRQDAKAMANAATGVLVAGGAALAAGIVIFATGTPAARANDAARINAMPVVSAGMTGILVRGRW